MLALSSRFWIGSLMVGAASNGAIAGGAKSVDAASSASLENSQSRLCYGAIAAAEAVTHIPDAFLSAIGRVESGRVVSSTGAVAPWPWTINAAGIGHFYATKADAVAAVYQFQAQGVRSLDVGCLQVNLFYHPDAFASVDQAFDPTANAAYAARFLLSLHTQTGSWPRAAAAYHSSTPLLGQSYQQKVLAAWAEPDRPVPAETKDTTSPQGKPATPTTVRAAAAPPAQPAAEVAAAPRTATGFTRTVGLRAAPSGVGRSLAAYRAMPVRLAMVAPPSPR